MHRLLACALFFSWLCSGAIDGKWAAKVEMPGGKKQGAEAGPRDIRFDLKSSGGALTGTIIGLTRKGAPVSIEDGKIEGDRVSFATVQSSKKGNRKFLLQGTVTGDDLHLTRALEGRKRGLEISAKRQ